MKSPKNKTVYFCLIFFAILVFFTFQVLHSKSASGLIKYSGKDFSIFYPATFKISSSFPLGLTQMISPDFKIYEPTGNIESGFTISVSSSSVSSEVIRSKYNFESIDICNRDYERWQTTTDPCLLSKFQTDYPIGKVEKERVIINGLSAIRYHFTSGNGRNNIFGAIIDKDDKQYEVDIFYRTFYDEKMFNQILNSFVWN